ncbi:hypothetical protein [Actinoplanes sp. M2I2]|uniref:hypothetical protein n=1 Tax=Actinoplanes sp. M2I2 TaxID=1734444 RepID=UPI0020205D95|nr:hypothetical protein [Actinoplanes sp. M2I2]
MITVQKDRTTHTEAAAIMPFGGWEITPAGAGLDGDEVLFRFPAPDDPAPSTARLLTMAGGAALLGFVTLGVGARAFATVLGGAPFWYVPTLALFALLSLALTVGAFLSIHRAFLPWVLLVCATGPLAVGILIAATY